MFFCFGITYCSTPFSQPILVEIQCPFYRVHELASLIALSAQIFHDMSSRCFGKRNICMCCLQYAILRAPEISTKYVNISYCDR
jgi:hypothetical protein